MKIDYSRVTCPVSLEVIADCECQNCVLARLEEDYEGWKREEELNGKLKFFVAGFAAAVFVLLCLAVRR